jgi:anti-sigma factor RsiW
MNETHPSTEQLVDYLHGELPPPQDAALHAHLAGCASCAQAHAEESALTELLRAHARAEERELPASVATKIREAAMRRPSGWDAVRSAFRPVMLLPAAAAIAVVLYVGFGSHRPARATMIDASYYVDSHAALAAAAPFAEDAPMPTMLTSDNAALPDERPVDETK